LFSFNTAKNGVTMDVRFVDLKAQYETIKTEVDQAIEKVVNEAAFISGKYASEFENAFARYLGVDHCIGVGNGTDALYIALRSLGIRQGDEVITAANSFVATSEAITMAGAQPVFVDCDPETFNIDLTKLPNAITPKTKAIIPVHLYGRPVDMVKLMEFADGNGLMVVEDAAQAHGAMVGDKYVGTWGHVASFSFYPGKNLGAYGDAGAVVTSDEKLAQTLRMTANHGRCSKYDHEFEGVNSRMDGIQAAILSVKLKHLKKWTKKRRNIAYLYSRLLEGTGVVLPTQSNGLRHVYHIFVVRVGNRNEVRDILSEKGIATGIHYPIALPNLSAYSYLGHKPEDFPVASIYANEILSLPIYPEMSEEQVAYVCEELVKIALPLEERKND
jgi:dTDP-4-amino-4,6-dideoxygalactose transaminase